MPPQRRKNRRQRNQPPSASAPASSPPDAASNHQLLTPDAAAKWLPIAVLTVLAAFLSVLYFGHLTVPTSDYTAFLDTGRYVLDFFAHGFDLDRIGSFKRLPGYGLLLLFFGLFMPGPHPHLTAGWFVNALAFTATAPLLYLLARGLLGRYAKYVVLLTILNPFSLQLLRDPIVETTLIFAFVLGFTLILGRSRFRYPVLAACSLLRYEIAVLILIAFLFDQLDAASLRRRALAFLHAALAALPMALWLLGTLLAAADQPTGLKGTYLSHYRAGDTVFAEFLRYTWLSSVSPLLGRFTSIHLPDGRSAQAFQPFQLPSQIVLVALLLAAAAFPILNFLHRRKSNPPNETNPSNHSTRHILALFLFTICYVLLHASRYGTRTRYAVPIAWAILLLAAFGLQGLWNLLNRLKPIPRPITLLAQTLLLIAAIFWFLALINHLPQLRSHSPTSYPVLFVALAALALLLLLPILLTRRTSLATFTVAAAVALMLVCNQFSLALTIGQGNKDIEFKKLAHWYLEHYQPGDKLVTSLPNVVAIYAPDLADSLVQTGRIPGDTASEFTVNALQRHVTYVAWDSRIGLATSNSYYKAWGIDRLRPLTPGQDIGPYDYLTTLTTENPRRFIHLYRLETPPDGDN